MRGEGKGRRALGASLLLLSVTIGAPALSAAQDAGSAPDPAAPVAEPAPPPPAPSAPPPVADTPDPKLNEQQDASDEPTEAPAAPAEPAPPAPVQARAAAGKNARASASATVSTGDNFYSPASVSVFVGDTVTWRNTGAAQHSATADDGSFDTGIFAAGQSRSVTFDNAGTFSYFCTVHGQAQSGTVQVRAATDSPSGGGGGGAASSGSSEAAAVAAPDAAGTGTSLPSTGLPALLLAAIGMALLSSGVAAGRAADRIEGKKRRSRRPRLHSIY